MSDLSLEERVRRLEAEVQGKCPSCGRLVKDWKSPTGAFAPEAWATLREHGIDPSTGHLKTCTENVK